MIDPIEPADPAVSEIRWYAEERPDLDFGRALASAASRPAPGRATPSWPAPGSLGVRARLVDQ